MIFCFNDTAPTEIYTLSLHDALPISEDGADPLRPLGQAAHVADRGPLQRLLAARRRPAGDRLLEVGVHALVRVQLRTVCGEVEALDLRAVLGQPVPGQADRKSVV